MTQIYHFACIITTCSQIRVNKPKIKKRNRQFCKIYSQCAREWGCLWGGVGVPGSPPPTQGVEGTRPAPPSPIARWPPAGGNPHGVTSPPGPRQERVALFAVAGVVPEGGKFST